MGISRGFVSLKLLLFKKGAREKGEKKLSRSAVSVLMRALLS